MSSTVVCVLCVFSIVFCLAISFGRFFLPLLALHQVGSLTLVRSLCSRGKDECGPWLILNWPEQPIATHRHTLCNCRFSNTSSSSKSLFTHTHVNCGIDIVNSRCQCTALSGYLLNVTFNRFILVACHVRWVHDERLSRFLASWIAHP